jgi:hypothetical protein
MLYRSVSRGDYENKEFPYRKYELASSVKYKLEKIVNSKPNFYTSKWSIPEGKVVWKADSTLYYLIDTVIGPSLPNHWLYDQIVDYYCEEARIKTPGYGEKYSVYDYWINPELHKRWRKFNSKESARELLYKNITEARPAYSSIAISLYYVLGNLLDNNKSCRILDIAAYGERAIASAGLNYNYDGVDPNYDLIEGHNKLLMDLKCLKPDVSINFYHVGLEDFKTPYLYDIITLSPPPFTTEPYSVSNKEMQSYSKYPTYEEYICCFLTELVYKSKKVSKENGIFAFTALDRNPKVFPIRINKEYQSEYLELIYVELLLLITSCFGFNYIGAIGLSAGDKSAQVPWWVFKNKYVENDAINLLQKYYPNIYTKIGLRIISTNISCKKNMESIKSLRNEYKYEENKNIFIISSINNDISISNDEKIILELIRYQIQKYVIMYIDIITSQKIGFNKIKTILGRYLMLRSILATFDEPWNSYLYVDPIFPTYQKNDEIENQIIEYFKDIEINIVKDYKYWFGSYECIGITNLYDTIAHYISSIPLSNIKSSISKKNNIYTIKVKGLHNIIGYSIDTFTFDVPENIDLLVYIRYETLGARGHQFTRPNSKTKILENVFNNSIIDIYASEFNAQSKLYCSIYPDVEKRSVGSAFCLKMIEGAYMANPVDISIFVQTAIKNIENDLYEARINNKTLLISMGFTLWLDTNPNFIDNFTNKTSGFTCDNTGLQLISTSIYLKAIYILDKKQYPSVLLSEVSTSRNTISVGVILSSSSSIQLNISELTKLVENEKYLHIH